MIKNKDEIKMKEKIKIKDLLLWTGCGLVSGNPEKCIFNISTDSRTIKEGDFFIPIAGENYNGHDFIGLALGKGACGFVFESQYQERLKLWRETIKALKINNPVIIKSQNNLTFLNNTAHHYIRKFNPTVIGIRGSAGKTTAKNLLVSILSRGHKVEFTPGNYNTEIGVSKSILEIDSNTEIFIAELGMRGKGQIKLLSDICNLNIGAITSVGESHLAFFKNLEEIAIAKSEMADILYRNNGVLFLNNDDKYSDFIEKRIKCKTLRFGRDNNVAFNFIEKDVDDMGKFEFDLLSGDKKVAKNIKLNVPGYHNIYNACCAAAIALYLGIDTGTIKKGIEDAIIECSRMEVIKRKDKIILDDCYNANPLSVKRAIDTLALISKKRNMRSVAIIGDMLELGSKSPALHTDIGKYLSEKDVDVLIAVGSLSKNICKGFKNCINFNNGKSGKSCYYFNSKEELMEKIDGLVKPGDIILIKGSRANKMEDIMNLV
jgi:UDP-N-acetylmuramoyl-tripeptide--D-alanyl-D-alanine ligase